MGDPIYVVFWDVYPSKIEEKIVAPMKPHFCKRYVDGTHIQRKKNKQDNIFEKINCFHPNIKLTIEKNPAKFLDTEIIWRGCRIQTKVYNKSEKLPVYWSSKFFTRYKFNDFNFEVKRITKKFSSAGFPIIFIRNTIEYFSKDKADFLIPEWLFDEPKLTILRPSFSESNEKFTKSLIKKLVIFTNKKI